MDLKVYDWANQGMYLNLKETLGPPRQPRGQKQIYSMNVGHKT